MSDRIKVGVKVRPLILREKADNAKIHWRAVSDDTIIQVDSVSGVPKGEPFLYDHVFAPASSNQEVFEALVRPIVEAAVRGFNGTIFAYGQTASGKTYTMMGDQYEPGVIPQAVNLVFNTIENTHGREFLLRVCYMEIYNERVNDLLAKNNKNLKVSEDCMGNVFVKDLQETITSSPQMVMDLMKKGETIRKIGVTNMNERSSRSHSIFRVIIESRIAGSGADEAIQVSHLNLVDLAGSERAGATGCVGEQLKEGCAINKSLFSLGKVIAQLSEGGAQYVNFRDSKLTRILQSSLGGNALTAIICAVTPAAVEETSSTLGFASRARNIKNTATVNEVLSDGALLKRYVKQIDRLTSKISTLEQEKTAENQHLQKENDLLQERISRLRAALLTSDFSETSTKPEKIKKLRRRTWSAPNRSIPRMSIAQLKFTSISGLEDILEEDRSGASLFNGGELDTSGFATPLEEFEKALIKAERDKSMDGSDWFPPNDVFEDCGSKAIEEDMEHNPPISYVQTRRQKNNHGRFPEVESAPETPPSKLRAKISVVERELDEMNEFARLEKQVYDEELVAAKTDLRHAKAQLSEILKENQDLKKCVKSQQESILLLQNERADFDIQLDMKIAKYETRIKDLTSALEDARYELSLGQQTPQRRQCIGELYSVEEEPSIEELVSEVKCLKDENRELIKFQTLYEDACKKIELMERLESMVVLPNGSDPQMKDFSPRPQTTHLSEGTCEEHIKIREELARLENINVNLLKDIQTKEDLICKSAIEMENLRETLQMVSAKPKAASEPNLCDIEKLTALEDLLKERDEDLSAAKDLLCRSIEDPHEVGHTTLTSMLSNFLSDVTSRRQICGCLSNQREESKLANESENEWKEIGYVKPQEPRIEELVSEVKCLKDENRELIKFQTLYEDACKKIELMESLESMVVLPNGSDPQMKDFSPRPQTTHLSEGTCEEHIKIREELARLENINVNLLKDIQTKEDLICKSAIEMENLRETLQMVSAKPKAASEPNLCDIEKLTALEDLLKERDEDLSAAKDLLCRSIEDPHEVGHTTLTSMLSNFLSDVTSRRQICGCLSNQRKESKLATEPENEWKEKENVHPQLTGAGEAFPNPGSVSCDKESVTTTMEVDLQSERLLELEDELKQIRTLLMNFVDDCNTLNVPVTTTVSELLCTLSSVKSECEELKKHNYEIISQLELLKRNHADSINLAKSEMEALEKSKGVLVDELENQNMLLKETERETRHLREKVRASSNKPCTFGTDSEGFAEEMARCKTEVELLLAEKEALQAELKSKHMLLHETEEEVRQLKGVGHELWRTLQEEDICKSCSQLKENYQKEKDLKSLLEEKLVYLQNQCQDLEEEIKSARNSLIAEVNAISERSDLQDLSLSKLITDLMNSVMMAQKHVASVLQSKIDFYRESLEAYDEREAASVENIQKMERELEELSATNAHLAISLQNSQVDLEESKEQEKVLLASFRRLGTFLNVEDENLPLEALISVLESRIADCQTNQNHDSSIAQLVDDNKDLQLKLQQAEEQVFEMRKSTQVSEEKTSELEEDLRQEREMSKKLQDDAMRAEKSVRDLSDELEHKTGHVDNLQVKLNQLEQEVATMEEKYSLKQKEEVSKRDEEIEALLKEVSQKKVSIDCLTVHVKELEQTLEVQASELEEHKLKLETEVTQRDLKLNQMLEELEEKAETIGSLSKRLENLEVMFKVEKSKLENDFGTKLDNEMSKTNDLRDSLMSELHSKSEIILKLEETIVGLKQTVLTQSKQISSKESIQSKASSLYNDLSEQKELVSKLEKDVDQYKVLIEDKDEQIQSLLKSIDVLKGEKSILEANIFRANADRDLAIKNLALKMKEGPKDEVQELKADLEFGKKQFEEAVKASRDLRSRNRKLQADLAKYKNINEEQEKSVNDLMEQLCQLTRTRSSRASDVKMKNEARDARQTKSDLEALKEAMCEKERDLTARSKEATNLMKLVQDKEQIIKDLNTQLEMCKTRCAEQSDKILELDRECEDMVSWGKSVEQNHSDLADRLEGLLKDLADSKMKLFSAGVEKIVLLKIFIEEIIGSVSKLTAEQIEMQISSKEKAVSNAKARVEKLGLKIGDPSCKLVDFDLLQNVCADVHTENEQIYSLGEEVCNLFMKVTEEKKRLSVCREICSGCEELRKWGIEMERLANVNGDRVDQLEGLLQNCNCTKMAPQKKSKSDTQNCQCGDLLLKVQTQRTELADRKAEIVKLKMLQEVKNKPLEDAVRQLKEKLKLSEQKNTHLKAEIRRMHDPLQEPTVCSASRRQDATTQTFESNNQVYQSQYWSGGPSGIIDESNRAILESKCRQLEKEKDTYKKLCISRKERIDGLEKELRQFVKDKENQENQHHGYVTRSRKNN